MFIKLSFIFWALLATGVFTSLCIKAWEFREFDRWSSGKKSAYNGFDNRKIVVDNFPCPLTGGEKLCMGLTAVVILVCGWYLITLP